MFKIKHSLLVALFIMPFLSFSQSKSDVCNGDFSLPSYEERWKWKNSDGDYNDIKFSDGTEGRLYYGKDCNRYYVVSYTSTRYYYNSYSDALKALYAYKKHGCHLKNYNEDNCD